MTKLTSKNYYSQEANKAYWSASFVKAMYDCPARALAELEGEYIQEDKTALLVGSYVDSYFEGEKAFNQFMAENPVIFNSRTGELKTEFRKADEMCARAEGDAVFMSYLTGQKQKIFTGTIDGIPFKCKMDFYKKGERIVDLKTVRNFEPQYRKGEGLLSFAEYWRYPLQMAIYQHLEGHKLPCYLACISKETPCDIDVIEIPQELMDAELKALRSKLPYFDAMRQGIIEPERCGHCAYCRQTKKVEMPSSLYDYQEF